MNELYAFFIIAQVMIDVDWGLRFEQRMQQIDSLVVGSVLTERFVHVGQNFGRHQTDSNLITSQ